MEPSMKAAAQLMSDMTDLFRDLCNSCVEHGTTFEGERRRTLAALTSTNGVVEFVDSIMSDERIDPYRRGDAKLVYDRLVLALQRLGPPILSSP
jgi:hypothetical protein